MVLRQTEPKPQVWMITVAMMRGTPQSQSFRQGASVSVTALRVVRARIIGTSSTAPMGRGGAGLSSTPSATFGRRGSKVHGPSLQDMRGGGGCELAKVPEVDGKSEEVSVDVEVDAVASGRVGGGKWMIL